MKRISGVICLLLTLLLCLAGCEYFAPKHEHEYSPSYDETGHFQKCDCGEITDKAEHSLEWVINKEPTYTSPGYKHQECRVCKYKHKENIMEERLIHEDVIRTDITGSIVESDLTWYEFNNFGECQSLFNQNQTINNSFYCVNPFLNEYENLQISNHPLYSPSFSLGYNNAYQPDDLYICDSYFALTIDELTISNPSNNGIGFVPISIAFRCISLGSVGELKNIEHHFYKFDVPDLKWNYMIEIRCSEKIIGYIFYLENSDISKEWIVKFIEENTVILTKGELL